MVDATREKLMQHVAAKDFSKTVEQLTFEEANIAGKKVRKAFEVYYKRHAK